MSANNRSATVPSPAVSQPSSVGAVESCSLRSSRERESPRLAPSWSSVNGDSKLESEGKSRPKSFIILKPQSMHPTFTRIHGAGISEQEQSEREEPVSRRDEGGTHVQDPPRASSAVGTEIGLTTSENLDPFAGIAADVTDASGRRVLMTPQQLESRLGAEHGLGRPAVLGAVPPLSFASLAAFAPTPASPSAGGGDQDSSFEQEEQDVVRELRQVWRHARARAARRRPPPPHQRSSSKGWDPSP
jgi:hypothetical protein